MDWGLRLCVKKKVISNLIIEDLFEYLGLCLILSAMNGLFRPRLSGWTLVIHNFHCAVGSK